MLVIVAGKQEFFDDDKQEFIETEGMLLSLEHSLISLSKWESKFQKPFLSEGEKTTEEVLDYIRFMIVGDADPLVINELTNEDLKRINAYIESPQSATTFGSMPKSQSYRNETVTSELIYYWMVAYNIPFDCESWHLNRLLNLIKICNIKNGPQKKMSKAQIAQQYHDLNEKRKAELGTRG